MKKRRVLVTGANGQLGNALRLVSGVKSNCEYIFAGRKELDITNGPKVLEFIKRKKISVIINCAAYTNMDKAEVEPEKANLVNNIAVGYLAEAAKLSNATLIHISTNYVFDGEANTPYTEESKTNPTGVYGKTKLAGEQRVIVSGCKYIILRTQWLYSKWGDNMLTKVAVAADINTPSTLPYDQIGTPTCAAGLAMALNHIISANKDNKSGIYNFSDEGTCTPYDFAKMYCRLSNTLEYFVPFNTIKKPKSAPHPKYAILDKTKFINTFTISLPYWVDSLNLCVEEMEEEEEEEMTLEEELNFLNRDLSDFDRW